MGCFNLKCSISNKTIKYGDSVAVIMLSENKLKSGIEDSILIYNDDKYLINTVPVFGTYNDYGGVENIEDSHGLRDILNHYNIEIDKDIEDNKPEAVLKYEKEELINKLLDKNPLMHIKREIYDYIMSDEFKKLMVGVEYGSNLEYYKEEDLEENKESIEKVYNKWVEYYSPSSVEDEVKLTMRLKLKEFSRMDGVAYMMFNDEGIDVPRCLQHLNNKRYFVKFNEYNSGVFSDYFDKLVQLDRLINVLDSLGVRIFPTLYGSQDNDGDYLWDAVYDKIPKTEDEEDDED